VAGTSGGYSLCMYACDVNVAGTGSGNLITISGLTNLASGTADILISQISTGLTRPVTRLEKLERMIQRLSERLHLSVDEDDCESPYHEVKEAEPQRRAVALPPLPKRGWLSPSVLA